VVGWNQGWCNSFIFVGNDILVGISLCGCFLHSFTCFKVKPFYALFLSLLGGNGFLAVSGGFLVEWVLHALTFLNLSHNQLAVGVQVVNSISMPTIDLEQKPEKDYNLSLLQLSNTNIIHSSLILSLVLAFLAQSQLSHCVFRLFSFCFHKNHISICSCWNVLKKTNPVLPDCNLCDHGQPCRNLHHCTISLINSPFCVQTELIDFAHEFTDFGLFCKGIKMFVHEKDHRHDSFVKIHERKVDDERTLSESNTNNVLFEKVCKCKNTNNCEPFHHSIWKLVHNSFPLF